MFSLSKRGWMAYKRYITRNGKRYGPYYYESKRVNGKVVSTYVSPPQKKIFTQRSFALITLVGLFLAVLSTLIRFLSVFQKKR